MLTDQVCFIYPALFILIELAKNHVQRIFDRTIDLKNKVFCKNTVPRFMLMEFIDV